MTRRYRLAHLAKTPELKLRTVQSMRSRIASRCWAGMPGAGRIRDEIEPGLRSFCVNEYIIYYKKAKRGGIRISRVLHGRRDQAGALRERPKG